jgi:dihydroxyacetone kinase-like predicted kinase
MASIRIGKEHEGKCVAILKGKVVLSDKNITRLMRRTMEKYPNGDAAIATVPKGSKILIL